MEKTKKQSNDLAEVWYENGVKASSKNYKAREKRWLVGRVECIRRYGFS